MRVIYLPGHTLGCVAYIIGDAIFVGDALRGSKGGLRLPAKFFSTDFEGAIASVRHIETLAFNRIYPAHGADVEFDGKKVLAQMLSSLD